MNELSSVPDCGVNCSCPQMNCVLTQWLPVCVRCRSNMQLQTTVCVCVRVHECVLVWRNVNICLKAALFTLLSKTTKHNGAYLNYFKMKKPTWSREMFFIALLVLWSCSKLNCQFGLVFSTLSKTTSKSILYQRWVHDSGSLKIKHRNSSLVLKRL